jgi:hypothetical protein
MRPIPEKADQAVRFILERIATSADAFDIEAAADLGEDTVRQWFYQEHKLGPSIKIVRRALNAIGYDLAVVPLNEGESG